MKIYLVIAFFLLFCVWLYIIYKSTKNTNSLKKVVGSSFWSLRTSMTLFSARDEENINPKFLEAYRIYKKNRLTLLSIWLFSILCIVIVTIIAGILFANIR
jgi:hypothetical protein